MSESEPKKGTILPHLIIACAIFLAASIISFTVLSEDAYISFRYAENIARGWGPVFNFGGERVEGFSNPLWIGILALIQNQISFPDTDTGMIIDPIFATETVARVLGLIFGILVLREILLMIRDSRKGQRIDAFLASIVVATSPMFLFWAQSGLENALYIFLLLLSFRYASYAINDPKAIAKAALPALALILTRPEGILFIFLLITWFRNETRHEKDEKYKTLTSAFIMFILFAGLLIVMLRVMIFHEFLPNTFYAKVNNGLRHNIEVGYFYLMAFLDHYRWLPLTVPALMYFFFNRNLSDERKKLIRGLGYLAVGQIFFILYVGGDIHPYDRFALPFILFSVIASFLLIPDRSESWKNNCSIALSAMVAIIFLIGNFVYSFPPDPNVTPSMVRYPNFLTSNLSNLIAGRLPYEILEGNVHFRQDALDIVGNDLKEFGPKDYTLATDQCGKIPYRSGLRTIDLFGLNDPVIASIIHSNETWDIYATEILDRSPDIFVVFYRDNHLISKYYLENTIMSDPFRGRYCLDAVYTVDYFFRDSSGKEHEFTHELLRFRKIEGAKDKKGIDENEERWLTENQPIIDHPMGLMSEVEAFKLINEGNPDKLKHYYVQLN